MQNPEKKAAVFPSRGIGDAILMMIACHHLKKAGYDVTLYHPTLEELKNWFESGSKKQKFAKWPSLEDLPSSVQEYDLVIVQNDNSPRMKVLYSSTARNKLSIFYPSYVQGKHFPLDPNDFVFASDKTMAENIAIAVASLLGNKEVSKDNGLYAPHQLTYRKEKNRVVIHPLSNEVEKNWPVEKYEKLGQALQKKGFVPVFVCNENELPILHRLAQNYPVEAFLNLEALAIFIYESGYMIGNDSLIGHLASNLAIPTLIIANDSKRMRLWRPGWLFGEVITPYDWIPNFKFLRIRSVYWKLCISVNRVYKGFIRLALSF